MPFGATARALALLHAGAAASLTAVLVLAAPAVAGPGPVLGFRVGIVMVGLLAVAACGLAAAAPRPAVRVTAAVLTSGWSLLLARALVADVDGATAAAVPWALGSAAWAGCAVAAYARDRLRGGRDDHHEPLDCLA